MAVKFNNSFFSRLGHSARVTALLQRKAEAVAARAKATAPVDTGAYRNSIAVRIKNSATRNVALVVAEDPKSMLIESETGNLLSALNAETTGG
jgi:hypothetical protein